MAKANVRNAWIGALILSGFMVYQAQELGGRIGEKVDEQSLVNQRLDIHINTYEALKSQTKGWDQGLMSVDEIGDVLGLYQIMDIEQYGGMQTDLDSFQLASSNVHTVSGHNIGVIKVCVSSGGRRLNVANGDYQNLVQGFNEMAEDHTVSFSGLSINGGSEVAEAQIADLCLLMRSGGNDGERAS